ncbi:MAG: hypothetical protein JRJ51_26275, partial [Deltaproteobacteria bacterium]|nr:hypothetical protein [Deltaproteobacteria bacterium]
MKQGIKFWWFAAFSVAFTIALIIIFALLFWQQLLPGEQLVLVGIFKRFFGYVFIAVLLLMAGLGFALVWVFRFYILPLDKLTEETETILINSANPSHRIHPEGSGAVVRLGKVINEWAEQFEKLQSNIEKRISQAKSESEEEKNILAAIMAELPEGVLICNREGQILLYNK